MPRPTVRIATAHLAPCLLDPAATTTKILTAIHHAASQRATLISFPESFLPGFPIWSALLPPAHPATHAFFARFAAASVYADGPEISAIRAAARKHGIAVSLGFSEKARYSAATLWNSNVIIDRTGEVRVHHRKLQPTFYERLSWGMGDGKGLETVGLDVVPGNCPGGDSTGNGVVASTPQEFKLGALICGENTNPLARYALVAQGEDVHISSWPAVWPTHMPAEEDSNNNAPSTGATSSTSSGNSKNYDNILANRLRAGAHCFEAKCFGIMSAAALSADNIATLTSTLPDASEADRALIRRFETALGATSRAASMVLDPAGRVVKGWVVKTTEGKEGEMVREEVELLREEEGVLFADLDLELGVEGKQYHDLVGGYQRFDVFELSVDRRRREPVVFK